METFVHEALVFLCSFFLRRCRRKLISGHFDETWEDSDCKEMCDHCKACQDQQPNKVTKDVTIYAEAVIRILLKAAESGEKLTSLKLLNALLSTGKFTLARLIFCPLRPKLNMPKNSIFPQNSIYYRNWTKFHWRTQFFAVFSYAKGQKVFQHINNTKIKRFLSL